MRNPVTILKDGLTGFAVILAALYLICTTKPDQGEDY